MELNDGSAKNLRAGVRHQQVIPDPGIDVVGASVMFLKLKTQAVALRMCGLIDSVVLYTLSL